MQNRCVSTMWVVSSGKRGARMWCGGRRRTVDSVVCHHYFDILCNNRIPRIAAILFLDVFESSWQRMNVVWSLEIPLRAYTRLTKFIKTFLFSRIYLHLIHNILICSICWVGDLYVFYMWKSGLRFHLGFCKFRFHECGISGSYLQSSVFGISFNPDFRNTSSRW